MISSSPPHLVRDPVLHQRSPLDCRRVLPHSPLGLCHTSGNAPPLIALGADHVSVPMPDQDTPDDLLAEAAILRRATEHYPLHSAVLPSLAPSPLMPTVREAFTQSAQRKFKSTLDDLDSRIRAKLEQPFGKENLSQVFRATASILAPCSPSPLEIRLPGR